MRLSLDHESNLNKQGLLALTFKDLDDYERIQEADRIGLVDLSEFAPNQLVECRITHADGTRDVIWLSHSFSDSRLEWFRAGSALNLVREKVGVA